MSRYDLAEAFRVDEVAAPDLPPRWNVAPTQDLYIVRGRGDGRRVLNAARWGLVPSWAEHPKIGSRLINARAESLSDRPAYRTALQARRALVPVSGFYEWQRPAPGGPTRKRPFYFCRADGQPLALAGLWEVWAGPGKRPLCTCTIITTKANPVMAPVHHRMPVVLPPGSWDEWLAPGPLGEGRLGRLLEASGDTFLRRRPVSDAVNHAANDAPQLIDEVAEAANPAVQLSLME